VTAVKAERATLKEKTEAAEERAARHERRIQELEQALRSGSTPPPAIAQDTSALEEKLRKAEQKASLVEDKLRRAEERVQDLEIQLANRPTSSSDVSAPPAPDIPGGPPPPPPPMPAMKVIDSSKLNIKAKSGQESVARKVDPREQNMANLIDEIRKGVKLKAVAVSEK
jgi:cell division septum initiation protein DivIVA